MAWRWGRSLPRRQRAWQVGACACDKVSLCEKEWDGGGAWELKAAQPSNLPCCCGKPSALLIPTLPQPISLFAAAYGFFNVANPGFYAVLLARASALPAPRATLSTPPSAVAPSPAAGPGSGSGAEGGEGGDEEDMEQLARCVRCFGMDAPACARPAKTHSISPRPHLLWGQARFCSPPRACSPPRPSAHLHAHAPAHPLSCTHAGQPCCCPPALPCPSACGTC